jgi:hydroxymethylglutaryl-CoA lyase
MKHENPDDEAEPMGKEVQIVEVSPRDGLQNESALLPTEAKAELIKRAVDAGLRRVEVASFVNAKRVPQMADAEALLAALPRDGRASYIGLVLNRRGLERALAAGVSEVNFVVVASDTFNRRNQGVGTDESLAAWREVARAAQEARIPCSITIGAAFGCPFEGEVPVMRIVEVARRAAESGPSEIALADTIGVAAPSDVTERLHAVNQVIGNIPMRCHLHNTRNTGLANAYAAIQAGIAALDSSIGGIGGCPFAPASTGNIPTEDLLYMLNRMRVYTGLSISAIIETARWLEGQLSRPVPGMLVKSGLFPPVIT